MNDTVLRIVLGCHGCSLVVRLPTVVVSITAATRRDACCLCPLFPVSVLFSGLVCTWSCRPFPVHMSTPLQIQRLLDIDVATRGEVQVPHLGEAFLTTIHHINTSRAAQQAAAAAAAAAAATSNTHQQ